MGKDANKLRREVIGAAILHPRVAVLEPFNAGVFVTKWGSRVQGSPEGWPDLAGHMDDGRALYVELKTPNDRLSGHQAAFLLGAQSRGCIAGVVRSVEEFITLIEEE